MATIWTHLARFKVRVGTDRKKKTEKCTWVHMCTCDKSHAKISSKGKTGIGTESGSEPRKWGVCLTNGGVWSMKPSPSQDIERKNTHILKWKNGDYWQPFNAEGGRETHLNWEHFSFFMVNRYQGRQRGQEGKGAAGGKKVPFSLYFMVCSKER